MVRPSSLVFGLTAIILIILINLIRKKISITTETKTYRLAIAPTETDQSPLKRLASEATCPVFPIKTSGKATIKLVGIILLNPSIFTKGITKDNTDVTNK